MTSFADEIRAVLARGNRSRFGASAHHYELRPTMELDLPDELATFAREVGAGGAGPGYGIVPLEKIARVGDLWPVAHMGCGYVAAVHARGDVVLVTPTVTGKLADGFLAWYADWLARLGRNAAVDPIVEPGTCALAGALSAYLGISEQRGDSVEEALGKLGPGAIAIAAEDGNLLFAPGDALDPCVACATMMANLGVDLGIVAPGVRPLP